MVSTTSFSKALRKLKPSDVSSVVEAVGTFTATPRHPGLHFEAVSGKAGVHTIRATLALRIFLKATEENDLFELVEIGPHDFYR